MVIDSKQIKFRVTRFALSSMQVLFGAAAVGCFFFDELTLIGKIVFSILFIWISVKFWKLKNEQIKIVVEDFQNAQQKFKDVQKPYSETKRLKIKQSTTYNRKFRAIHKKKNR